MSDTFAPTRPRCVVIFGGSDCPEGTPLFAAAEALGRRIAERGWTTATGGYGGIMLAASRGAARAGGTVIGVTCSAFSSRPNAFLTREIETRSLLERLGTLIELGDGYVVMPGSTGTLAELALAWELVNKRLIAPRPIVCWGDFWRPVVDVFAHQSASDPHVARPAVDRRGQWIRFAHDVEAAMAALEAPCPSGHRPSGEMG